MLIQSHKYHQGRQKNFTTCYANEFMQKVKSKNLNSDNFQYFHDFHMSEFLSSYFSKQIPFSLLQVKKRHNSCIFYCLLWQNVCQLHRK